MTGFNVDGFQLCAERINCEFVILFHVDLFDFSLAMIFPES